MTQVTESTNIFNKFAEKLFGKKLTPAEVRVQRMKKIKEISPLIITLDILGKQNELHDKFKTVLNDYFCEEYISGLNLGFYLYTKILQEYYDESEYKNKIVEYLTLLIDTVTDEEFENHYDIPESTFGFIDYTPTQPYERILEIPTEITNKINFSNITKENIIEISLRIFNNFEHSYNELYALFHRLYKDNDYDFPTIILSLMLFLRIIRNDTNRLEKIVKYIDILLGEVLSEKSKKD